MMNSGIPAKHQAFWESMSVEKLYSVYASLSVTTGKVLNLLKEPATENPSQEVWIYRRKFIGNMTLEELRTFLRFVTGSFVISVTRIMVSFNNLDGLARRPISHTCSATLELPSTYRSLPEFISDFRAVLSDPYYSWMMDSV